MGQEASARLNEPTHISPRVSGSGAVVALVLVEWAAGLLGAAAWTQSWGVIKAGHFRIVAWSALLLVALAFVAQRAERQQIVSGLVAVLALACVVYLVAQRASGRVAPTVAGIGGAVLGAAALSVGATEVSGWPPALAAVELLGGAVLLGAVTNGMLLGHWYLNQPGLQPWALGRLTDLALVAVAASVGLGAVGAGRLMRASTAGAGFGLPGLGDAFAKPFFWIWVALVVFTGVVVFLARKCVQIRSIQSATGLLYVALLTAGVSEFLVRYLMLNLQTYIPV